MHRHLLLLAQTTFSTFHTVLHSIGDLTDGRLHLIHTDVLIEVFQNILDRTLLRHIALDVALLYYRSLSTATDKLSEDVLSSLHGQMSITEGLVLYLDLVLEITLQLIIGFWRKVSNAIACLQTQLTDIRQLVEVRGRQTEGILETVGYRRITLKEVIQTLGQSGDDNNGIIFPLVHLHKEFIQRVHLIGILVRQQFLDIVKEQDTILCLLDVFFPLVDKALVVDGIDHRQLRFVDNLVLIEIVTEDFCQSSLTRSCLTDDDGIHGDTHLGNVLTRTQEGIGIDNHLQLLLDIVKTNQLVEQVLTDHGLSAPLAELGYAPVFLMAMFTYHYSTSFSIFCIISEGLKLKLSISGLLTFSRLGL